MTALKLAPQERVICAHDSGDISLYSLAGERLCVRKGLSAG